MTSGRARRGTGPSAIEPDAGRDWPAFSFALLAWAAESGRALAIREAADPWAVLVAEVMSQQTQIDRVGQHWAAFVERWPTPAALAQAATRDLLAAWSGLGYNRRALALRDAARAIVQRHGGAVPRDVQALDALPGIGPYTARAVAAIAFGVAAAPVDVNVRRVIGRVTGEAGAAPARLQALADASIAGLGAGPEPRAWVNALMDLASTVCLAGAPRCPVCPVAGNCAWRLAGSVLPDRPARQRADVVSRFEETNRWLRGRILRDLHALPAGAALRYEGDVGSHGPSAVREALAALERDGFLEIGPEGARIAGS